MARKSTVQILRTADKANSTSQNVPIQDGELLYDKATNKLFIGDGTTTVSGMKQISAIPSSTDDISVNSITINGTNSLSVANPKTSTTSGASTLKSVKIGATNYNIPTSGVTKIQAGSTDTTGTTSSTIIISATDGLSVSRTINTIMIGASGNSPIATQDYVQAVNNQPDGFNASQLMIGTTVYNISGCGTTYYSGTGINISGNTINVNTSVVPTINSSGVLDVDGTLNANTITVSGNNVATEGYVSVNEATTTSTPATSIKIGNNCYPIPQGGGSSGVTNITPYGPDSSGNYSAGTSVNGSVHIFGSEDISAQYTSTNPTGIKLSLNHIHAVPYVQVYSTYTGSSTKTYNGVLLATSGYSGSDEYTGTVYAGSIYPTNVNLFKKINSSGYLVGITATKAGNENSIYDSQLAITSNGLYVESNNNCFISVASNTNILKNATGYVNVGTLSATTVKATTVKATTVKATTYESKGLFFSILQAATSTMRDIISCNTEHSIKKSGIFATDTVSATSSLVPLQDGTGKLFSTKLKNESIKDLLLSLPLDTVKNAISFSMDGCTSPHFSVDIDGYIYGEGKVATSTVFVDATISFNLQNIFK